MRGYPDAWTPAHIQMMLVGTIEGRPAGHRQHASL